MEGWKPKRKSSHPRSRPCLSRFCSIVVGLVWLVLCSSIVVSHLRARQVSEQPAFDMQEYSAGMSRLQDQNSHFERIEEDASRLNFGDLGDGNLTLLQPRSEADDSDLVYYENDQNSSASGRGQSVNLGSLGDQDLSFSQPKIEGGSSMEYADTNNSGTENGASAMISQPYYSPTIFEEDFNEMIQKLKIFVYPHSRSDPFRDIFLPVDFQPTGNYASESYFKKALMSSHFVTTNASEANLFYLPFSIARLRHDKRVGVGGLPGFVSSYIANVRQKWPYWNRTGGSDHFYLSCHSISKVVADKVDLLRVNAIQVVCSSNNFIQGYIPHKDVSVPQVWPRKGTPPDAKLVKQRNVLAFFAGAANSPVRAAVVKAWSNDPEILVHPKRIVTPYSKSLLTSKFCLHVKGYEVNTARIADAMHFGCVPVIIANHYDLPFEDVLDWEQFSLVVSTSDILLLKKVLKEVTAEKYEKLQKNVMKVRRHFEWHAPPKEYDAFYMVMYELWLRRHVVRFTL